MTIKFDRSKLLKNLSHGNVLAPFLDRAFDTFDEPLTFTYTEKEKDDAWHPSGHCLPKVTDLYALATGELEPTPVTGSLRKSFMVGHYWHQVIQHIVLEKLGFADAHSIERRGYHWWGTVLDAPHPTLPLDITPIPYHWVTGAGDIAPLETPKWRGIVDIKTMSSQQFKQNQIPDWAADKYRAQINLYMDLFDEEQGMILAVNKDAPHDLKEFRYDRDQKLIDAIYTKWKFVSLCLDAETPPTEGDDKEYGLPL